MINGKRRKRNEGKNVVSRTILGKVPYGEKYDILGKYIYTPT